MLDDLLFSLVSILLCGFFGGHIARKLGAPPLLGMMLVGILLGSQGGNFISQRMLDLAGDFRTMAVTVILMRAGLGLDRQKLAQQGTVALRLGFLPALTEAIAIALLAIWLFDFDWLTGLLLGCVISAESPAVIVPGMLRLKNLGWGVSKGIADAILTGSALSDVLVLLLFSLLLNFLTSGNIGDRLWLLPVEVLVQIVLGVAIGYLAAKLIVFATVRPKWVQNNVQKALIAASVALTLVVVAQNFPYFSGYLAVMAMGFFIIKFSPPLARQLRQEFNHLWIVAEILLFVLMGATIELKILENVFLPGLVLLTLGLLLGRTIGWYLATAGSNWTWREKLFLLPGNSAKATVQAAIGAVPLSMGIPKGDLILAIAALSILVTAPLGAWAIPTFAPKLLTKDEVDPSQSSAANHTVILGIIELEPEKAIAVLTKVADLARRTNGEAVIVGSNLKQKSDIAAIEPLIARLLLDIPHQVVDSKGEFLSEIATIIDRYQVTEVVLLQKYLKSQFTTESQTNYLAEFILDNTNIAPIIIS